MSENCPLCRILAVFVSEYLDTAIDAASEYLDCQASQTQLRQHLLECTHCREVVAREQKLRELLHRAVPVAPAGLEVRIRRTITMVKTTQTGR